jgi:hypothetical protein
MVHYSAIVRNSFLCAMVTLLVTILDFGMKDPEEGSSQPAENI